MEECMGCCHAGMCCGDCSVCACYEPFDGTEWCDEQLGDYIEEQRQDFYSEWNAYIEDNTY